MKIPVVHCINNKYVIPAAVSFYSMLKNANKNFFYELYVLHNDITDVNQHKLISVVEKFEYASLKFISMADKFQELFNRTKSKGHYSLEMYYKFLMSSIFPQYDKVIVTDVDVVFLGDVSEDFLQLDSNDDWCFAGVRGLWRKNSWLDDIKKLCWEFFGKGTEILGYRRGILHFKS